MHREFVSKETNSTSAENSQRKNTRKPVTDTVKSSSMTKADTVATVGQQFCLNDLDQVALIKLVGDSHNQGGHTGGPHQFYAVIDTGATRTICSRRLAEVLFGKWLPCDEKSFKMFNGDLVRYEVMIAVRTPSARRKCCFVWNCKLN